MPVWTDQTEIYMEEGRLTEKQYWDGRWDKICLPAIMEPTIRHPVAQEILRVFQDYLPKGRLSVVEIGGAPGQYCAYFSKYLGYRPSIIEYSEIGCQKTRENFRLLDLDINVYERDFLSDLSDLPRFDVVMSLGFIEHFDDLEDIFRRHVNLLAKGGILILGVPNFRGIAGRVLAWMAPDMLARHNLEAMDLKKWTLLESTLGMVPLFKGYVGGFYPKDLQRCERRTPMRLLARRSFKMLQTLLTPFPFLRKWNSASWSAYLIGVYQLP